MSKVMSEKEPELQDFGITPKEYYIYHEGQGLMGMRNPATRLLLISYLVVFSVVFLGNLRISLWVEAL